MNERDLICRIGMELTGGEGKSKNSYGQRVKD